LCGPYTEMASLLFRFLTPFSHLPHRRPRNSAGLLSSLQRDYQEDAFHYPSQIPCSNIRDRPAGPVSLDVGSRRLNLQYSLNHSVYLPTQNGREPLKIIKVDVPLITPNYLITLITPNYLKIPFSDFGWSAGFHDRVYLFNDFGVV
jgi:hypothetical protein